MRRAKRRPVYYQVSSMNDGTVLAGYPIRKIPDRLMKQSGQRLDEDNVCSEHAGSYVGSFDFNDPGRFRFFDIMANRLNVRRSLRELVVPRLAALESEVASLREQLARIEALLTPKA